MMAAYQAGAKYIIVFNYPKINAYGILKEEHFTAMKKFWRITNKRSTSILEKVEGEVAYILPNGYGWGMRNLKDKIWGFWPADELSLKIWDDINGLIEKHDSKLDIIYDDDKYRKVIYWNSTIN